MVAHNHDHALRGATLHHPTTSFRVTSMQTLPWGSFISQHREVGPCSRALRSIELGHAVHLVPVQYERYRHNGAIEGCHVPNETMCVCSTEILSGFLSKQGCENANRRRALGHNEIDGRWSSICTVSNDPMGCDFSDTYLLAKLPSDQHLLLCRPLMSCS